MATYDGSDKQIGYLFDEVLPTYSTSGRQCGTWIDGNPYYETVLVVTISSASSVDEVIYDLSVLGFYYIDLVSAMLDVGTGFWPIVHELNVDGTDLVYNGSHGSGTAYITVRYC